MVITRDRAVSIGSNKLICTLLGVGNVVLQIGLPRNFSSYTIIINRGKNKIDYRMDIIFKINVKIASHLRF